MIERVRMYEVMEAWLWRELECTIDRDGVWLNTHSKNGFSWTISTSKSPRTYIIGCHYVRDEKGNIIEYRIYEGYDGHVMISVNDNKAEYVNNGNVSCVDFPDEMMDELVDTLNKELIPEEDYKDFNDIEDFTVIKIFDKPIVFTEKRIDRSTLPYGCCSYEIRHSDNDCDKPAALENDVYVNFYGTAITIGQIDHLANNPTGFIDIIDDVEFVDTTVYDGIDTLELREIIDGVDWNDIPKKYLY